MKKLIIIGATLLTVSLTQPLGGLLHSPNVVEAKVNENGSFSDIKDHWAKSVIDLMVDKGVVSGYQDGTFKPGGKVTNAHVSKMLSGLIDAEAETKHSDIADGHWSKPHINRLVDLGIIDLNEYPDGFHPKQKMSRLDVGKMIAKALAKDSSSWNDALEGLKQLDTIDVPFKDKDKMEKEDLPYIALVKSAEIINGDNGYYLVEDDVTRAHTAAILARFLDAKEQSINVDQVVDKYKGTSDTNQGSNTYKSSNYSNDYFNIELIDSNTIKFYGETISNNKWLWFQVNHQSGKTMESSLVQISSGEFSGSIHMDLPEGEYEIDTYVSTERYGSYPGFHWGIPLYQKENKLFFPQSPVYDNNVTMFDSSQEVKNSYVELNLGSEEEEERISDLANEITEGLTSDYEKVLAIHDWVSDNIYYDYDAFYSGDYGKQDAIATLDKKRAVCQGYAELTEALLQSLDIPAKLVNGFALGVSTDGKGWDEVNHNDSNHAWNEAFVDGRWIILDTTWDSSNKYENGEYLKGNIKHRYFDPTLEVFSNNHKIIRYY
ncbi:S-layer homology domain-containing protein [Gracilibacillus sp. YIM 98692]|uniref:transglutaminase domain-containing protein n=1 Tax=Gracilibacillus sp. YIM 98692 TaxID=2663532 RepID=UPI0013D7F924|nr:S-layer homology domain-containing protein [Gracilibacillus sp. YIM 98692]